MTRLLAVLAMLLSIAAGPVAESAGGCVGCAKACAMKCCCHGMACCARKEKEPAPVQQKVGRELAAALAEVRFDVLFTLVPAEARRAPRALFADRHSPEPLSAGCIRLI
jgi:hypothetical protein